MLKLDNGVEIPAKTGYMKDNTKCFKIDGIDINKIRVSKKSFTAKNIIHASIMCFMNMLMITFY